MEERKRTKQPKFSSLVLELNKIEMAFATIFFIQSPKIILSKPLVDAYETILFKAVTSGSVTMENVEQRIQWLLNRTSDVEEAKLLENSLSRLETKLSKEVFAQGLSNFNPQSVLYQQLTKSEIFDVKNLPKLIYEFAESQRKKVAIKTALDFWKPQPWWTHQEISYAQDFQTIQDRFRNFKNGDIIAAYASKITTKPTKRMPILDFKTQSFLQDTQMYDLIFAHYLSSLITLVNLLRTNQNNNKVDQVLTIINDIQNDPISGNYTGKIETIYKQLQQL
jgi:hypothetical protein